jgi:hypothetical protein
MSEEFDNESESESYSVFWPAVILLSGLLIWSGYQVYAQNSQRMVYNQQFQAAIPTINQAQVIQTRYVALMKDLIQTASKDQYAAGIVKEAETAGLLRVQQNADTNSTSTPTAPATPPASTEQPK